MNISLDSNRNSKIKNNHYRNEINGLRAFAVIAVIINHFNKQVLPGGYLGVDIFFVISGYVITSSLFTRKNEGFYSFILGFYERRIKRLLPALIFFILIIGLIICLINPYPRLSLRTALTSLLGLSNLYLLKQTTLYFSESTNLNVFAHTWSLGVEEQFYFLFPFLTWLTGFARNSKNGIRNLFLAMCLLTITSLLHYYHAYSINPSEAYFTMPTRFWEISSGCLVFILIQKKPFAIKIAEKIPPLFIILLMIGVMFLPEEWGNHATLSIVGLSCSLLICLRSDTTAFNVFTTKQVVYIGLISYSLYLWHWGVLSISYWTVGVHWYTIPFQILLILCLAVLSYHFIEIPFQKKEWFMDKWKTITAGSGILFIVSGGLLTLSSLPKGILYIGSYPYIDMIYSGRVYNVSDNLYNGSTCGDGFDNLGIDPKEKGCLLDGTKSSKTFYFLGNSHTSHFRESQYLLHQNDGVGVYGPTESGCGWSEPAKKHRCKKVEERILTLLKKDDLVFISNRHVINSDKNRHSLKKYYWMNSIETINEINDFNKRVRQKGGLMVLILPLPEFELSIAECTPDWFRVPGPSCSQSVNKLRFKRRDLYEMIHSNLDESIRIFDPLSTLCIEGICSMTDKYSKPLYVDNDHITDYANSQYIYPFLKDFLTDQGLL